MPASPAGEGALRALPDGPFHVLLTLCGARAAGMLSLTSAALARRAAADNAAWRCFAAARWGHHVRDDEADGAGGAAGEGDWLRYYRHRCCTWRPAPSPLDLFQEHYGHDPWALIASCVLSSRTGGGPAVKAAVAAFFERYPTPSAVLDAPEADMRAVLLPLGLNRERTIPKTAAGFLSWAWGAPVGGAGGGAGAGAGGGRAGAVADTGAVSALHGCGAFAQASWRVFCHGEYAAAARDATIDRNVRAYAAWAVREEAAYRARLGAGGGAGAGAGGGGARRGKKAAAALDEHAVRRAWAQAARQALAADGAAGAEGDDDDDDDCDAGAGGGSGGAGGGRRGRKRGRSSASAAEGAGHRAALAAAAEEACSDAAPAAGKRARRQR